MRGRGDAYYASAVEPRATELARRPDFDPLADVLGPAVTLVSSADETAFAARAELARLGLLREPGRIGEHRFLSSGDIDTFRELGGRLLGPELAHTERWPLDRPEQPTTQEQP